MTVALTNDMCVTLANLGADGFMVSILKIPEEEVIFSSMLALEMCNILSRDLSTRSPLDIACNS